MTALKDIGHYVHAIEIGADDFITRPVNPTVLRSRVSGYLRTKRLSDEVDRLNRLKEDLTRMIVHDLNSPMCSLMITLGLLKRRTDFSPEIMELVDEALRSAQDASRLINNLLGIEKLESGTLQMQPQPVDIPSLVGRAIDVQSFALQKAGLKVLSDGPALQECWCDKDLISRVIQNLISNAIKFATKNTEIAINWEDDNGNSVLSVSNHGPTIGNENQVKIFDRFAQLENRPDIARKGCGLGLSFCKMVMEAHGGSISIQSPPTGWDDGVRFQIRLPSRCPIPHEKRRERSESQPVEN